MISEARVTTGFEGLDEILDDLRIGDNVVWRVDDVADYRYFVKPFVQHAIEHRSRVVYIRFAQHEPVVEPADGILVYELDALRGFESFTAKIYSIISEQGLGVHYVFDCLSDLLSAWATDLMIGNFFRVTCPYLFELQTVAYFALMRGSHSFKTISRIRETTQVLLDLHHCKGAMHIQPLKVWKRRSPTMFLPHIKEGDRFVPVANSYDATNLLTNICQRASQNARRQLDYWDRLFLEAEDLMTTPTVSVQERQRMVDQLCRVMIGHTKRMLSLAQAHFSLEDLLDIKSRMIGTGFIGGKAVGMLLARKVLLSDPTLDWRRYLEPHDSFYLGSDVYYSYLVHNGWWELLMQQKTKRGYFEVARYLKEKMQYGSFSDEIREEFQKMMGYFGQYPIILRSSSLLEDDFGNAFAGKYESFFCVNQGTPEDRLKQLEQAIRNIYASAMSEDALTYRLQRGLDQQEEQMALLIQRVSGAYHGHYYLPELAGVGISYNPFVWSQEMDPKAGMLRLVLGLGTRAVERVEGDYPRIVALDTPLKSPQEGFEGARRFSQRDVDLLNVNDNALQTISLLSLERQGVDIPLERYGVRDRETARKLEERGEKGEAWLLTFDALLSDADFPGLMQRMLKTLEAAYEYPVDVEFTANFAPDGTVRINLLQCRPLQTKGIERRIEMPGHVEKGRIFFETVGHFMGGSISQPIRRIIWVDAEHYARLTLSEKYDIARLVGRLNKSLRDRDEVPTMLLGPGRWGTSTPSLGVPVSFAEINNFVALGEVAFSVSGMMPELSFGTHFFLDLVETDIFFLALYPGHKDCYLNKPWLDSLPNALEELMPSSGRYKDVVKVCDFPGAGLRLMADVVSQRMLCYW